MKTIVKYANRKLYDKEVSKYTTIAAIASLPLDSFKVVEYDLGVEVRDLTIEILLQALSLTTVPVYTKIAIMQHYIERFGEIVAAIKEGEENVTEVQS